MLSKITIPIGLVLFSLYVVLSILTSGGNALSEAMIYLAAGGFLLSLLNPSAGMIFVFVCGNYLDFLKRFLVVGGGTSFLDVIKTLAVPPVAMTGVIAGILVNYTRSGGVPFPFARFILAILMSAAVVGAGLLGGQSSSGVLQSAANSALYVWLIAFAAPIYRDIESQHRLFRLLLILFIPVMCYGYLQLIHGYGPIDVAYARSGFTANTQPLLSPKSVEYKRIYSTMSSANSYSVVGTMLSIYALIFGFGRSLAGRVSGVVFALLCLSSQIPGAGRTGWVIIVVAYFGYFVFHNSTLTKLSYAVALSATLAFIVFAEKIGVFLVRVTQDAGVTSDFALRAINMGTFTTRTSGIAEWMGNRRYFSIFGLPRSEIATSGVHDQIGQIYLTTGVVGLSLSVICVVWTLIYLHKNMLTIKERQHKRMAAFYMGNLFAVLFAGVFSGTALHIFPLNLYFWLMAGLLFQLIDTDKRAKKTHTAESTVADRPRMLRDLRPSTAQAH